MEVKAVEPGKNTFNTKSSISHGIFFDIYLNSQSI